jgi:hypothetical protein
VTSAGFLLHQRQVLPHQRPSAGQGEGVAPAGVGRSRRLTAVTQPRRTESLSCGLQVQHH